MKAIILAAGKGTRISRMVEAVPKSTLPINGVPLIRITVEKFIEYGIEPIVCVGYESEKIKKALSGLNVKYYTNPFFDITNSLATLWFANEDIEGELVIINADVYFSGKILDNLLASPYEVVMAMDTSRTVEGDYFFKTTDNGCISKYGKELPLEERSCEYVGLVKISETFTPAFRERLNNLIAKQCHHMWWENVLYSFADEKKYDIHTMDVSGIFWSEIDYFDDYERILNYISKKE